MRDPHPRLVEVFTAQRMKLIAAFQASESASSDGAGSLREVELRDAIQRCLPPTIRVTSGEIIDIHGGQTGQLDGVVIDATGVALAFRQDDASQPILAEGVVRVIESKSNLSKQWSQVLRSWEKLKPIRRHWEGTAVMSTGGPLLPGVPFVVFAYKGWSEVETMRRHVNELASAANGTALVVQLHPAAVALVQEVDGKTQSMIAMGEANIRDWAPLQLLWQILAQEGQRTVRMSAPYGAYGGGEPPRSKAGRT